MNPTQPTINNQPDFIEPPLAVPLPELVVKPPQVITPMPTNNGNRLSGLWRRLRQPRILMTIAALLGVLLIANTVGVLWLLTHSKPATVVQLGGSSGSKTNSQNNISDVLSVDMPTKSVGVDAIKPQGLQVGATIKTDARGTANVRVGLLNGSPTIIFENSKGTQWQLGISGDSLQYGQVGQTLTNLSGPVAISTTSSPTGSQIITSTGVNAKSTLTIQGTAVTVPNNLSIDSGTLYIDSTNHQVAIGAQNAQGYKLYVAGTVYSTGSITANDQIFAVSGNAAKPGYAFQGANSSGLFASSGTVSIGVNGSEVLRVQPGNVSLINANLQTDGYIRAGTGAANPSWKIERLTGTITSTDMDVAHGIAGSNHILIVEAYYLDGSGNAQSIFGYFNNTNVHLTNGIAGQPYRISIIYSSDGAGW